MSEQTRKMSESFYKKKQGNRIQKPRTREASPVDNFYGKTSSRKNLKPQ